MIIGKKAQGGEDWIKKGLLAVVILLLLMLIFNRIFDDIRSLGEDNECITSVNLASIGEGEIICPTTSKLIDKGREEEIIDEILFEQYRCGRKFSFHDGTADKNPFKFWPTDSVCVMCSNVSFSTKAKAELKKIKPADIILRSTETYVPRSSPKKTYYEFFTGNIPSSKLKSKLKREAESDKAYGNDLVKNDFYVIYAVRQATTNKVFWTSMGIGAGATGGTYLLTTLLLPGAKIKAAGFFISVAAGAALGGGAGKIISEKTDISILHDAAVVFVPKDAGAIKDLGCHTLGNDPFENPFKIDEEEEIKEIIGG